MQLLGYRKDVDFQALGDQAIELDVAGAKYIPFWWYVTNASASLDAASGGLFTEVNGGGEMVFADGNTFEGLGADPRNTVRLGPNYSDYCYTDPTLYFRLTSLSEGPAVADMYLFGLVLP